MSSEPIRILMVEDDEEDYIIVRRLLGTLAERAYDVAWVESVVAGAIALGRSLYDVVLLDYEVGGNIGLELLKGGPTVPPVILLTGHADRYVETEAREAGVADFLLKKTLSGVLLEQSVDRAIERRREEIALRVKSEPLS